MVREKILLQIEWCVWNIPFRVSTSPFRSAVAGSAIYLEQQTNKKKLLFSALRLRISAPRSCGRLGMVTLHWHWTIRIKWTFSLASITRSPMWRHFQPLSQRVSRCCRQLKTHNCAGCICAIWSKPNHTQMGVFMCTFEMSCENNADFLLGFVFCIIISPLLVT